MAAQSFLTRRTVSASRLKPPLLPRAFVSRAELLAKIADARYVAVVAPGGYGKTCLMSELAASADTSVWFTVREEDSDAGSLAFGIATAIAGKAASKDIQEVQDVLSTQSGATPQDAADMLVHLLSEIERPILLIIDDCHLLDPESSAMTLLDRLLADAPEHFRFAYCGRTSLPVSELNRAHAAGLLVEIDASDLKFEVDTASAALSESNLSAEQVETVTRLCEGWPALIRLAASLLTKDGESLQSAGGDRAAVYKYIATELFAKVDPATQTFLLKTSFCDSFTAQMAEFLVEAPVAAQIKKAEATGWLQKTKTQEGISYSYHPLLADFLWTRHSTEAPAAEVQGCLIRAGEWMASKELWDEAFNYWKKAGANHKIVEQFFAWEQAYVEYWPVHGRWLTTLSVEDLSARPRLMLRKALGYQLSCNVNEAFRWQAMAEEIIAKNGNESAQLDARLNRAQLNFFAQNIPLCQEMYLAVEEEEERLTDIQKMMTYSGLALVQMHLCENLQLACDYLEKILKLATETRNWRSIALAVGNLMTTYRLMGDIPALLKLADKYASEASERNPMVPHLYVVMALAATAVDLGLDTAEEHMKDAIHRCSLSNYNWLTASLQGAWALHLAERGLLDESEILLEKSARTPTTHVGIGILLDTVRALLAAKRGDREEAKRCLSRVSPMYTSMSSYEPSAVLALLLLGERQAAAERAAASVKESRRRGMAFIEASALFMLAAADGATTKDLQRLIELSKEYHYDSIFLRRWREFGPKVLTHALARHVEPDYVIKLLRQTGVHTLRVQTFGGLRVWLNDVELDDQAWERPKSKALFAYLVVQSGKPAHAEEIAELFWPDQDIPAAKNSLRVAATRIRKAIEREEKRLIFEGDHYRLELGPAAWEDRKAFQQVVDAGLDAEDPRVAAEFLRQALDIFSGPFLPEYRYEEWAEAERERLEDIRRKARLRLSKHLVSLGEAEEALPICEAAILADPFDESAVRLHMRALAKLQRQDEARRVFRKLEKNLSEQLRSKPTEATLRLVQELGVL